MRSSSSASISSRASRSTKIREEHDEKSKRLVEVERLLKRPAERWKIIRKELLDLRERFGDKRRTQVSSSGREDLAYDPDAYIVHEEATVLLSRDGWIRRVRELKDPSSARLREGDALQAVHVGTTRDRVALFSSRGVVYVIQVSDVPATTGYGEPVQSLFRFGDGERVVTSQLITGASAAPWEPQANGEDATPRRPRGTPQGELFDAADEEVIELTEPTIPLLVVSAAGYGFRTGPDLSVTTRAGRRFARVADGDELIAITAISGSHVFCLARSGKGLRFPLEEVAELSGVGRGVILMRVAPGDRLVGAATGDLQTALIASLESGTERAIAAREFPAAHRGGKGFKVVKRGAPTRFRRADAEANRN